MPAFSPPAVAIAKALRKRGHDVTFAGYANQRNYFAERGFRFVQLERSAVGWREEPPDRMFAVKLNSAWASSDHLLDLPCLIAQKACDALVVDCLMFGALAAAEKSRLPAVTFIHSAPGALMPPKGIFESHVLGPVNDVRRKAGQRLIGSLWEAWAYFPALSNSIRELDPLASLAPASFSCLGPMLEDLPPFDWAAPWPVGDRRPLVACEFFDWTVLGPKLAHRKDTRRVIGQQLSGSCDGGFCRRRSSDCVRQCCRCPTHSL